LDRPELSIGEYYARAPEDTRLQSGRFLLEKLRTQELIKRHIPTPPTSVLDVGGAAGAYAFWLTDLGYTVDLVDLTPRLVAKAQRLNEGRQPALSSCAVGDARSLAFGDNSVDVVLLLGPLYHLTEASERRTALQEALRVLRPGGWLFASAISRWASLMAAMSLNLFNDPLFGAIVERDVREGQHRNTTDRLPLFTTAYFHKPEELRDEIGSAGFKVHSLFGLEGPGCVLGDVDQRADDPVRRDELLRVARAVEAEPSMLGISDHLLAVARKPA
jgi:ubiquinone/menaquinone biosynthesis C-methylase UbiE